MTLRHVMPQRFPDGMMEMIIEILHLPGDFTAVSPSSRHKSTAKK
jgi:hypothetical protein